MAIDVGHACPATSKTDVLPANWTAINKFNPANAAGDITRLCLYLGGTPAGWECASFVDEGGNVLSTNGTCTIADVDVASGANDLTSAGGDFTAFAVGSGEYLGGHWTGGDLATTATGGSGVWYTAAADNIPASSVTFTSNTTWNTALGGEGEEAAGGGVSILLLNHSMGGRSVGGNCNLMSG